MPAITCRLVCRAVGLHVQQFYTGFSMLQKRGLVRLEQEIAARTEPAPHKPRHLRDAGRAHLRVIVNGRLSLYYDGHDSWEIDEDELCRSDFYFKRSYSPARYHDLGEEQRKIHPLGLSYQVYPDETDLSGLRRALSLAFEPREMATEIYRSIKMPDPINRRAFTPRVRDLEALPDFSAEPKVLFMARPYDPYDDPGRDPAKVEQRRLINESRAECIRVLRKAFGHRFYGGFQRFDYSEKNFPDVLMPARRLGDKGNYIETLKQFPICVATTGLHGSIGWKFAEYVAASKAIVSEPLEYGVTGDLAPGRNYLEFRSPEECASKAELLMSDGQLRARMMMDNLRYYTAYLRPDSLVLNSLMTALAAAACR